MVLTDASRLHGIGFALIQVYKEKLALIQCGSASLSPTQSRYSTVELECLAIMHVSRATSGNFYRKKLHGSGYLNTTWTSKTSSNIPDHTSAVRPEGEDSGPDRRL